MAGDWNLEASVDGKAWDVLHESRGRSPLYEGIFRNNEHSMLWDTVKSCNRNVRRVVICEYMEQNHRNTWKVNNTAGKIYTQFRFLSIEVPYNYHNDIVRKICLHGIGFEVYGDVYGEWGGEYTHIQQLENQQKEELHTLQTLNDSLNALRQLEKKRNATVSI